MWMLVHKTTTRRRERFLIGSDLSDQGDHRQSFWFVTRRCRLSALMASVTRPNSQSVAPDTAVHGRVRAILTLAHRLNRLRWSFYA